MMEILWPSHSRDEPFLFLISISLTIQKIIMPYRQIIAQAYDAGVVEEYNRLIETPLREAEYQLIAELLDEYIADGSVVIDIGSGPGRYAEHLLQRNCKVGVIDLSAKSLRAFSDRMENSHYSENIIFNCVSCATQLSWVEDNSSDAILLMGPLYHLINEEHRNLTLTHCRRILKPGGFLFTVFLSPFLEDQNRIINSSADKNTSKHIPDTKITHTNFQGYEIQQFRCMPWCAKRIMENNNFKTLRIRNIEGIAAFMSTDTLKQITTSEKKADLLKMLRISSETEDKLGITHQYLVISR
jgi:ubiquinone/menaquinone biosynthesis C-methylase UbiE